ncbi:phosphoribosyltransferase [Cohnella endophytica]|uniref:Phosphoribosyltransferase n=1 Tax=Cohnella endophytica TaxID=2419778 RepID=A0A494XDK2_9BACL|nr:phosphoribosyltransferase family protein [Cohnella endophytica]RKP48835.1 phosphoribosyltransferase [Cohnella endophytica]
MTNITSPVCSPKSSGRERLYKIADGLEVGVSVVANPYGIGLDRLFGMAARINKKRAFLFVSKLLGKHIAVHPALSLASGALLGDLYSRLVLHRQAEVSAEQMQEAIDDRHRADELYSRLMANKIKLEEPTLFIGFAETATALGHSMFEAFEGSAAYLHTTRETVGGQEPLIQFEEEHSHATAHRCYVRDEDLFRKASKVVLVDDEITTGRTSLNIIKELHEAFGHRDFVVASLLDWRSAEDRESFAALEQELGIGIRCLALVEGVIEVKGSPVAEKAAVNSAPDVTDDFVIRKLDVSRLFKHREGDDEPAYLWHTGRFGIEASEGDSLKREVELAAAELAAHRTSRRSVCIGTGEFMYVPMRIAALMGEGVVFQSTTRSPIHPLRDESYAITSAYRFDSVDDAEVPNFVYNIEPGQYDEAFVFVEREYTAAQGDSFESTLSRLGIPVVHLVVFGIADGASEVTA